MSTESGCYRCGRTYDLAERKRCECGEPLWVETDVSDVTPSDFGEGYGVWRYEALLPVSTPVGVGQGAGGTPTVRTERLDDYAGCVTHVKDEGGNPTGSFKDRGSAVGAAYAVERGREWMATVSHGNMAMSTSAHAASAGMGCAVFVPADIPPARLGLIAQYGADIVPVEGDYGQLYYDVLEASASLGVEAVNSDTPLRVEGHKTIAFELFDAFGASMPDGIVLPVSSGGNACGIWKGLRELDRMGALDRMPKLFLVQAAACDPIARAYRRGDDAVSPVDGGDTVAYSIANAAPPSGNRALAAVRETGGAVISVDDEEIEAAVDATAARAGLCVEPASATPLAGVRRLVEEGVVDASDEVALLATGSGFKEFEGTASGNLDPVALDDVRQTLADLARRA